MIQENFLLLTGAFGSGKSTLLQHLRTLGYQGIAEPARPLLSEQRSIDGNGVPDRDPRLFVELMLSRMLGDYHQMTTSSAPVFFDRGIPDALAYASLFGFPYPPGENAAMQYRYNRIVFFAPAWEQIYTTDDERTVPFEAALQFGDELRKIYERSGYVLVDLPCLPVQERGAFILDFLKHQTVSLSGKDVSR